MEYDVQTSKLVSLGNIVTSAYAQLRTTSCVTKLSNVRVQPQFFPNVNLISQPPMILLSLLPSHYTNSFLLRKDYPSSLFCQELLFFLSPDLRDLPLLQRPPLFKPPPQNPPPSPTSTGGGIEPFPTPASASALLRNVRLIIVCNHGYIASSSIQSSCFSYVANVGPNLLTFTA